MFTQKVEPIRGGRVAFRTAARNGPGYIQRYGRRMSVNFLGERDRRFGWQVYHERSGYLVINPLEPAHLSLAGALALAAKLEALTDWSQVERPSIEHGRLVASVTGTRLERVG